MKQNSFFILQVFYWSNWETASIQQTSSTKP